MARRAHRRRARPRAAAAGAQRRACSCSPSDGSIAGQIRAFDRALGERPGRRARAPTALLDRYPADLQAIPWHLLVADEALRYANPATDAHQALAQVRFGSVADCWLLTATPRGKSAEHLDVLVGLAVGDEAMIRERLNTREAGDLIDEINAHRLRVNYGPHLVRVTRQDMQAWMPDVRPAEPLAIEPDAALAELLEAIRHGGREAYRRLLGVLRELKTLEPGSELLHAARSPSSRASQGVVLGNVGVFVDASVDPETLHALPGRARARRSSRQGLVAEAMRGGGDGLPLLRGITAQTIAGVAGEEQVIVFAERVRCLRQLARTLRERHGVEAHVADGSDQRGRLRGAQAALQRRRVPGAVPRRGSATRATTSRTRRCSSTSTCRGCRPASSSASAAPPAPAPRAAAVQTYIPYIRGGGIEHVVSVLAPRGAEHHQILDSFEGVARQRVDDRHPARRDHRPGRRQQGRGRLRRHRRPAARRRRRLRRLSPADCDLPARARPAPGRRPRPDHQSQEHTLHDHPLHPHLPRRSRRSRPPVVAAIATRVQVLPDVIDLSLIPTGVGTRQPQPRHLRGTPALRARAHRPAVPAGHARRRRRPPLPAIVIALLADVLS